MKLKDLKKELDKYVGDIEVGIEEDNGHIIDNPEIKIQDGKLILF